MAVKITFSKLQDGSWGLRALGVPLPVAGDRVSVTKKDGTVESKVVGRVVWQGVDRYGDGLPCALCTIEPDTVARGARRPSTDRGGRWTGCACGSIEGKPRDSDCAQCRYDSE
jgi:hypothetical protein